LAPHIDLSRTIDDRLGMHQAQYAWMNNNSTNNSPLLSTGCHVSGAMGSLNSAGASSTVTLSSHTFILYLYDCGAGGETNILRKVPGRRCEFTGSENLITSVKPLRGRLLVSSTFFLFINVVPDLLSHMLLRYFHTAALMQVMLSLIPQSFCCEEK
jgi:hypothetical protein